MIVVTLKESLSRIKPPEVRAKEWNDAVRVGLVKAAEWLIENNLRRRKFKRDLQRVYGFAPRTARYQRKKTYARLVREPETGLMVQPAKPTADLVYTGRLRDFIMGRDPSQYRKLATATSNRVRVRVPIQVPGVSRGAYMRAEQFKELSKFTDSEYVEMRRIVVAEVSRILGFGGGQSEKNLWRRAG
jgi:hypothetical protein